jgi:hypothetical protein
MPRTPEEEQAFKEAVARHTSYSGYARRIPPDKVAFGKPQAPSQKVVKKKPIKLVGECAPEHIRILLDAEAEVAEKGRQAIAQLLLELNTKD